jgi:PD-(D/E)XK nuclease superfamily
MILDPVNEQIRISGKDLGAVALADFCPRCFWIKLHNKGQFPFQIFASIDGYTKRVVHSLFDEYGAPPSWLKELNGVIGYKEPPTYHKFNTIVEEFDILLTGSPDGVFVCDDGSYMIVDYKTAKYTATQDVLHPMYEGQLNAYAFIGEHKGLSPVKKLALIYMEPVTDDAEARRDRNRREDGFAMHFTAKISPVTLNPAILRPLLQKTREIWDLPLPPEQPPSCKNCQLLGAIIKRLS